MDIAYKKDGNENYMIIKINDMDEEDYRIQMVLNNNIACIVPMNIRLINNSKELYYSITSMDSMECLYSEHMIKFKDLERLVMDIKEMSASLREYLLDINNILFDMRYIYMNSMNGKFEFCYLPENTVSFYDGMRHLFEEILVHVDHSDKSAVLTAYGIHTLVFKREFTVQDLVHFVRENKGRTEKYEEELIDDESAYDEYIENDDSLKKSETKIKKDRWLTRLKNLFAGKSRYRDESEIESKYERYEDQYDDVIEYKEAKAISDDETMLLLSDTINAAIVLREKDVETPMEIVLYRFPCVLGKSKKSADHLIDNPVISRVHVRLSEEKENLFVEDLNSTNGTLINGIKLKPHTSYPINIGDRLTLADMNFYVEHQ